MHTKEIWVLENGSMYRSVWMKEKVRHILGEAIASEEHQNGTYGQPMGIMRTCMLQCRRPKLNLPTTYFYLLCQSGSQQRTNGTLSVRELGQGLFTTSVTGLRGTSKGQPAEPPRASRSQGASEQPPLGWTAGQEERAGYWCSEPRGTDSVEDCQQQLYGFGRGMESSHGSQEAQE